MKASDIRLGNWYLDNGEYNQVTPNTINELWESEKRNWIQPIELTPEILEKAGFQNDDNDYLIGIDDRSAIHINLHKDRFLIESYDGMIAIPAKPKYLHQLQNLHWILTHQELNINL